MSSDNAVIEESIVVKTAAETAVSSLEQAAILLMVLGEEDAAEVLKHMGPKEVQWIGKTMAGLRQVTREQVEKVFAKFNETVRDQTSLGVGKENYIRRMLTRALGEEKANSLIDRILVSGNTSGLDTLKWMDGRSIAELIRFEHPQIQAIVLAYLEPDQAAEVLQHLDERVRLDIMLRISSIESVQPQAINELNDILEKQFESSHVSSNTTLGGIRCTASIMNFLDPKAEAQLMEAIREIDEGMAGNIQEMMFVFENIVDIDDRGVQSILREVSSEVLMLALKGADERVVDKVFKNMSKRAADLLKEDLDNLGPVKVSEVEGAQKEILAIARRMAEAGEVIFMGRGEKMI